ncbi:MAG: hypothetical protein M0011_03740, partial [Elusimicrobia bacterium]|nr:hypothetical protein [Elusimicrobiota bacterium]
MIKLSDLPEYTAAAALSPAKVSSRSAEIRVLRPVPPAISPASCGSLCETPPLSSAGRPAGGRSSATAAQYCAAKDLGSDARSFLGV